MRSRPARIKIGKEVQLSSEEEQHQQQAEENASVCAITGHVVGSTELRGESLLGQEGSPSPVTREQREPGFDRLTAEGLV